MSLTTEICRDFIANIDFEKDPARASVYATHIIKHMEGLVRNNRTSEEEFAEAEIEIARELSGKSAEVELNKVASFIADLWKSDGSLKISTTAELDELWDRYGLKRPAK